MKLSIIIAILNSHEIVRRQYLHFERMGLPDDVEIIFVDDGSHPPLEPPKIKNFTMLYTYDKRQWTTGIARNIGARHAKGDGRNLDRDRWHRAQDEVAEGRRVL